METSHKLNDQGLEISLKFDNDEIDILKSDLNGLKGILDWYRIGPSQEKIYHCAKKAYVKKKETPELVNALIGISEEERAEALKDPRKMFKLVKQLPGYKDLNTKLTDEMNDLKAKAQSILAEADKLTDPEKKTRMEKEANSLTAFADKELAELEAAR